MRRQRSDGHGRHAFSGGGDGGNAQHHQSRRCGRVGVPTDRNVMHFLKAAALLSLAACSGPVLAQRIADTRVPRPRPSDVAEARRVTNLFGECVVKKHYALARRAIVDDVTNKQVMTRPFSAIVDHYCAADIRDKDYILRFPADTFRRDIALALYDRDLAGVAPLSRLDKIAPLNFTRAQTAVDGATQDLAGLHAERRPKAKAVAAAERNLAVAKTDLALSAIAECAIRTDSAAVTALLKARVTSRDEGAAAQAIAPLVGKCLTVDLDVRIPIAAFKGSAAIVYYRLAAAAGMLPPLESR